jgi:hypothetical protein
MSKEDYNVITPKEKAMELIKKFIEIDINTIECGHWMCIEGAKYCALISIDEIELYRNQIEKESNKGWQTTWILGILSQCKDN